MRASPQTPLNSIVMYSNDDRDTAKLGDRVIASVIGGLCGFLVGALAGFLLSKLLGSNYGLAWWGAAGFAAYAFVAPSRSTEIWSEFWESLLGFFGGGR